MASFKDRRGREEEEEGRGVERKGRGVAELLKGSVCVCVCVCVWREGGRLAAEAQVSVSEHSITSSSKGLY